MKKKKSLSILGIVAAVLLLIVVLITLTLNVLFSQHDTPKIFGNYVYLMESDSMEVKPSTDGSTTIDASASIHAKTAVICKAYDGSEPLSKNNAILCVLAPEDTSSDKDKEGMAIRRILNIASDEETGIMKYYPTTMQVDTIGTEPAITVDSVRGICRYESAQLYSFIQFATGFSGIIVLLALPCVLLIALLIVALVRRSANKREDDAYAFEESYDELPGEEDYNYDDEEEYEDEDFVNDVPQTTYQTRSGNTGTYNTGSYNMDSSYPSYGNTAVQNAQTSSFETKKSSISQNFERKAVNPNSAFQKAKTMQFQAQKNVPIPEQPYESVASQQPETNGYVGKYGADAPGAEPVQEAPQQEQTYHGAHEAPSGSSSTGSKTFLSSTGTFKRPNVDDIFGNDPFATRSTSTSRTPQRSTAAKPSTARPAAKPASRRPSSYDTASVDDLVAMIENQKKRL